MQQQRADVTTVVKDDVVDVLLANVQSAVSKLAALTATLRTLKRKPLLVCLNETWLDESTENLELEDYCSVARLDRQDGREGGGVAVYARKADSNRVTLVHKSTQAERVWVMVHSEQGPFLVCNWYRPPVAGEQDSLESFEKEWANLRGDALGGLVVGDLNLHHKKWLRHSNRNSAEGQRMMEICREQGLRQLVRGPTREQYLLDLVLTDVEGVSCKVLPKVADHNTVLATLKLKMPEQKAVKREVWNFKKADWDGMRAELGGADWTFLENTCAEEATLSFNDMVLASAGVHVGKRTLTEQKKSHPWLNKETCELVRKKREAEGTEEEAEATAKCSEGLAQAYKEHAAKTKAEMLEMPASSKHWWKRAKELQRRVGTVSGVPALKDKKTWVFDAEEKANLFAKTFTAKNSLPPAESNEYSKLEVESKDKQKRVLGVSVEAVEAELVGLNEESATGPDLLPTRVLKECGKVLARPVWMLITLLLQAGIWPSVWMHHWIVPLYKRKEVFNAENYRGVHLTSQLSKVVERVLLKQCVPFLKSICAYGPNQFAYTPKRGSRDALAYLTLRWLDALARGRKVGVYCSDVAGAFDKVCAKRLVKKLAAKKLDPTIIRLMVSWLRERVAQVVVEGAKSVKVKLQNMVYQGTVWGPTLWNLYFEDARKAINEWLFEEAVYADDLNAFRVFSSLTDNSAVKKCLDSCQEELHSWGRANRVTFEAKKESKHVLSLAEPEGEDFKILGVVYDCRLTMQSTCEKLACDCEWKLKTLLRSRQFHNTVQLVRLYKAQLLSFVEYRTAAIYHATKEHLAVVDRVQERFLKNLGISEEDALMYFGLAPLSTRRDIAMLGVLHRACKREGPAQFQTLFKKQLGENKLCEMDLKGTVRLLKRSAFGLVPLYNRLPSELRERSSVRRFQIGLQALCKEWVREDVPNWKEGFCPRGGSIV